MITITPIKMTGIFAALAEDFIAFKQAQGYKYYNEAKVLSRFCRFAENFPMETPALTKALVADWVSPREGEALRSRRHRITCVNQFGGYLRQMGYEVYAVPPQSGWHKEDFTPYIFTHYEIEKLFRAASSVQPTGQGRHMHRLLPVLIRLLYGCGLRVSETVGLLCRDVDFKNGILTIRETKSGRDRLIPLSASLADIMWEYKNDVIPWANDDDYFFMAPDRTILSPNTVYGRFRRIMWDGGIPYKGKGNGPRLHDVRHTFAVHTLQKWVENGEDLTAMLPCPVCIYGSQILKIHFVILKIDGRSVSGCSTPGGTDLRSCNSRWWRSMKQTDFAVKLSRYLGIHLPGHSGASVNTIRSYRDAFGYGGFGWTLGAARLDSRDGGARQSLFSGG